MIIRLFHQTSKCYISSNLWSDGFHRRKVIIFKRKSVCWIVDKKGHCQIVRDFLYKILSIHTFNVRYWCNRRHRERGKKEREGRRGFEHKVLNISITLNNVRFWRETKEIQASSGWNEEWVLQLLMDFVTNTPESTHETDIKDGQV